MKKKQKKKIENILKIVREVDKELYTLRSRDHNGLDKTEIQKGFYLGQAVKELDKIKIQLELLINNSK